MAAVIMARMVAQRVQAGGSVARLPELVGSYARRVSPDVLAQQTRGSVSSALGVWLLLAACVSGARGSERDALEEALGCSAEEASGLLVAFMASPPPALHAAIALWVAVDDATAELSAWMRGLPEAVQSGFMPTREQADAWAERETRGLIRQFPAEIDQDTRIVLASALATKVEWEVPFDVVPAADHCGPASPWAGAVSRLLWDDQAASRAMIGHTDAAGLVAVHLAVAEQDLTVVSVSAAPEVDRASVLSAAYEVAATVGGEWRRNACSLYDLPLGAGHSWEISEREVPAYGKGARLERIEGVALPAWHIEGKLELMRSAAFATAPALATLRALIGPRPNDDCDAVQAAVASFGRYGFEAAAITTFSAVAAAMGPRQRAVQRSAELRFDHPYGAVAIAGRPGEAGGSAGLPLFTAWVAEPIEPEDQPPAS
ncbi:MAG TPA: serpin family protein [Solirubrobacteraceae bacterium]